MFGLHVWILKKRENATPVSGPFGCFCSVPEPRKKSKCNWLKRQWSNSYDNEFPRCSMYNFYLNISPCSRNFIFHLYDVGKHNTWYTAFVKSKYWINWPYNYLLRVILIILMLDGTQGDKSGLLKVDKSMWYYYHMGVSLNGGTPHFTPQNDPFLVDFSGETPWLFGETHHFRTPPYSKILLCTPFLALIFDFPRW